MHKEFLEQESIPVVIGTGITGMAISRTLSEKKIKHFAIGTPPNPDRPKLGESINGEGSLDLEELFPEFSQYYFPKKNIIFYTGKLVTRCDLDPSIHPEFATFFKLTGFKVFKHLFHVDRLAFDLALFESVTQNEHCIFIDRKVTDIIYDRDRDEIQEIEFDDGSRVRPSFVFDATNHVRLVPKKLNIPCHFSSEKQRIIFTHYRHPDYQLGCAENKAKRESWSHSTNLLKLCQEWDGLEGMAWCIPLGDYVSVGMSMNAEKNERSDREVMELLDRAYQKRGIDYRQYYSQETEIVSAYNQYFIHERAGGANWLLAGGTFGQVWFPSGSGVATSLYTARFADRFLKFPQKTRQQYEKFMRQFLPSHDVHDRIISSDLKDLTYRQMYQWTDSLLTASLLRICTYARSRNHHLGGMFAQLIRLVIQFKIFKIKYFCKILESDLGKQTKDIHTEGLTYL
ncbi:MAG: NAD(P)/FAD-dependent oxidoreductase [Spirulina sp.]